MRKILSLIAIAVLVVFASCDKNEKPEFNDNGAFVSFERSALSVSEDGTLLRIPVTLASIKGISATIAYTVVDGTAKEGVNFTVVDPAKTLAFTADNRTQYIEINIINNPGVFTGDLKFQIQLSDEGTVRPNTEWLCNVTITDKDHPLAAFLGTWTATANSYYSGNVTWTVTLEKDPTDVSVLWIQNVIHGFVKYGYTYPSYDTRFYCIVNDSKDALSIPIGQKCAYKYQNTNDIFLVGLDASLNTVESGRVTGTVSADGRTITFDLGIYVYDATGGWDVLQPVITWTKN